MATKFKRLVAAVILVLVLTSAATAESLKPLGEMPKVAVGGVNRPQPTARTLQEASWLTFGETPEGKILQRVVWADELTSTNHQVVRIENDESNLHWEKTSESWLHWKGTVPSTATAEMPGQEDRARRIVRMADDGDLEYRIVLIRTQAPASQKPATTPTPVMPSGDHTPDVTETGRRPVPTEAPEKPVTSDHTPDLTEGGRRR